jgi:hypothetical protein
VAIWKFNAPLGGWGAKYTERSIEPNHRGFMMFCPVDAASN